MQNTHYYNMYDARLEADKEILSLVTKVVIYTILAFLIKDLILYMNTSFVIQITAMRAVFILSSIVLIYKIKTLKSFRSLNRIASIWTVIYFTMKLTINVLLKDQLIAYLLFDSIVIISIYAIVPLYLRNKLYLGVFYSIVDIALVFMISNGAELNQFSALFVLVCANFIGYYSAMMREQSMLKNFSLHKIERELLEALQKQLDEIKQLSGLLPICATCHNIRDDKGYWQKVDEYLTQNADLTFTHSICPNCSSDLLAELDKEES